MKKEATLSNCKKYRFELLREWDESKPKVMFIMLNPSTADADNDDPTIRRCIGFAKSWGYGGLYVGNLNPYRDTKPVDTLRNHQTFTLMDLESLERNRNYLQRMTEKCDLVICAWGNEKTIVSLSKFHVLYSPSYQLKSIDVEKMRYLEMSIRGCPKHPLYLRKDLTPQRF